MAIEINEPCAEYTAQMKRLELARALMGGKDAMVAAGEKFLPMFPGEEDTAYQARLNGGVLNNTYKRTINKLAGDVFSKDPSITDGADAQVLEWLDDMDLAGTKLPEFAAAGFKKALQDGIVHFLPEFNGERQEGEGPTTQAAEAKANMRPYLSTLRPDNIIGFQSEVRNGVEVVTQLRVKVATKEAETSGYGMKEVSTIYEINETNSVKWTQNGKGEWVEGEKSARTLGEVGLVTVVFGEQVSPLEAQAELQPLAELNRAHWNSDAVQRNYLRYARYPLYFGRNLASDDDGKIKFGPNRLINSTAPDSTLQTVEHQGHALSAGRDDLKDLEAKMGTYGLSLLLPRTGAQTATERLTDKDEVDSTLVGFVKLYAAALTLAVQKMAKFGKKDFKQSIDLNTLFSPISLLAADLIVKLYEKGIIPREMAIEELNRRNMFLGEWTYDTIKDALEADTYSSPAFNDLYSK